MYERLHQVDRKLDIVREIYQVRLQLDETSESLSTETLDAALHVSISLMTQDQYHKAKKFLRDAFAKAREKRCPKNDARLFRLHFHFAVCLWRFHFYGYDNYRDDLRRSIQMLETLEKLKGAHRPPHVDAALRQARGHQLDWSIHDLTPATFEAYQDS